MNWFGLFLTVFTLAMWGAQPALGARSVVAEIEPDKRVLLSTELSGVVDEVAVELGDRVLPQQELALLDRESYQLEVDLAEAQVQLSLAERQAYQRQLERLQHLHTTQSIADSQLEEQQRLFEVSHAQYQIHTIALRQAELAREKTTVSAPFAGVVSRKYVDSGQLVNPGDPVLEIVSIDRIKVVFHLLELDYLTVNVGDSLHIEVRALNNAAYRGVVSHIAPAQTSGQPGYRVEAVIPNPDTLLKPGFSARVYLPNKADAVPSTGQHNNAEAPS